MDHRNERYAWLAQKWIDGTITEAEKKEFARWYDQEEERALILPPSFAPSEKALRRRMLNHILKQRGKGAKVFHLPQKRFLQLAAAIMLLAGAAIFYFTQSRHLTLQAANEKANKPEKAAVKNDLLPGGNKAVLVLANGSKIELSTAGSGTIAGDATTKVVKIKEGQLHISSSGQAGVAGYNTLSTPRGGQYAITLSDGTVVWLNSASSLYFPNAFTGKERVVELTGEAYFEVARNAQQPFKVKVNSMEISVLGTHFNVMAYGDEEAVQTTLVKGSVRIRQQGANALLKPGQQAAAKAGGSIRVSDHAAIDQVLAWKNGLFNFEGATIETIMRQLARWYPISVVYEAKVPVHFTGTISKNVGIEKVFQMLELTGAVHFRLNGNQVTVHP